MKIKLASLFAGLISVLHALGITKPVLRAIERWWYPLREVKPIGKVVSMEVLYRGGRPVGLVSEIHIVDESVWQHFEKRCSRD